MSMVNSLLTLCDISLLIRVIHLCSIAGFTMLPSRFLKGSNCCTLAHTYAFRGHRQQSIYGYGPIHFIQR